MHILVVNDDGPPSTVSSPYVLDLVWLLRQRGHVVSVVLPDTQRSWIAKAHIVGQTIRPTYYRPPPVVSPYSGSAKDEGAQLPTDLEYVNTGTTHARPLSPGTSSNISSATDQQQDEWLLVNSTPATCVQIGLFHHPNLRRHGPIDLVLSGPNYGRNTTAVFALSSGTLGGALEAAVCNVRSVALSYAFFNRNHDPVVVRDATAAAVRVVESLVAQWDALEARSAQVGEAGTAAAAGGKVQLFSVNVPLKEGVRGFRAVWTRMLLNTWSSGSCFEEVSAGEDGPAEEEERVRGQEAAVERGQGEASADVAASETGTAMQHRHFKWAPRFADVYKSVADAPPGNDGWAVEHDLISVTPLLANFMHATGFEGDVER